MNMTQREADLTSHVTRLRNALADLTVSPKLNGPAGVHVYAISHERMEQAKMAVAQADKVV